MAIVRPQPVGYLIITSLPPLSSRLHAAGSAFQRSSKVMCSRSAKKITASNRWSGTRSSGWWRSFNDLCVVLQVIDTKAFLGDSERSGVHICANDIGALFRQWDDRAARSGANLKDTHLSERVDGIH